jgi:hypothetical protein
MLKAAVDTQSSCQKQNLRTSAALASWKSQRPASHTDRSSEFNGSRKPLLLTSGSLCQKLIYRLQPQGNCFLKKKRGK